MKIGVPMSISADEAINRWALNKIHNREAEHVLSWPERGHTQRWSEEQRQATTLDDIIGVEFTNWDIGYCETCSYIVSGVEITTKKRGGTHTWRVSDADFKTILEEVINGAAT